ncbi:MAG: polysaccharide pyruvyl transferase family protein [Desulfobacterium sp.]|nr:polysaccharide pyruvyl transferase family protein [Desulfobacterium sp.]
MEKSNQAISVERQHKSKTEGLAQGQNQGETLVKIGILTYHAPYNFGANLQALASSRFLEGKGHEVKIIDYLREESVATYREKVPKEQWTGHDEFVRRSFSLTRHVSTQQGLCEVVKEEKFNGIIVGADAVWSFPKDRKEVPAYFMDWLFETPDIANIPVASMSVANMSGGYDHLSEDLKQQLRNSISKFTALTVRDDWTKESVNRHLFSGKQVVQTINPDPVLCLPGYVANSLDQNDFAKQITRPFFLFTLPKNAQILANWLEKFKAIANENGYLIGELPLPDGPSNLRYDFSIPYPIDPLDWFFWIGRASGFVGLRFHAVISAIATGTPFFSIDSYGQIPFVPKLFNRFGFYRIGRKFNTKSKIHQLLKHTPFEANRVYQGRGLAGTSPAVVFDRLTQNSTAEIQSLQQELSASYEKNMNWILDRFNAVSKENR